MFENRAKPLLEWYEKEKRSLPWREDATPYHVWVSEIMLQQTRVEAVKRYYTRFLEKLPTIEALAECEEEILLKLWEGLGYYNRVKNMQKAAKVIVEKYDGEMPSDYDKILELPGIGSYTAGAIASIAFGIKKPAVDGNVLRVLARQEEWDKDIAKASAKKEAEQILEEQMPADYAGEFNQSLMELGATVCLPNGMPKCEKCPVLNFCKSKKHGTMEQYPNKSGKIKRRIEKKTVLLIQNQECFAVRKRPDEGLLAGLYEFPNQEGFLSEKEVLSLVEEQNLVPIQIKKIENAKHIFSHVEWQMQGYFILVEDTEQKKSKDFIFIDKEEASGNYPMPSAFSAYKKYMDEKLG